MNCWNILGIPPQTDLAAIRAAYAEKTRACHPEEDPEGFAALHEAYRAAMAQARQWRSRPAEAESAEPEPVAQKVGLLAPLEEQGHAPEPEEDLFAGTEFAHDAIRPEELRHLEEEPTPEGLAKDSAEALARSRLGNSESLVYSLLKENQMPDPQTLLPGDQLYWVARAQDACAAREAQAGQNAEPSPESDPQKDCTEKQEALLKRIWIGSLIVGLLVGIVCSQLPGGLRWAVLTMLVLFFAYRAQRAVVAALYDQIESDQTYPMPEEETDEEQE